MEKPCARLHEETEKEIEREEENEITGLRDAAAASRFEARFEQL